MERARWEYCKLYFYSLNESDPYPERPNPAVPLPSTDPDSPYYVANPDERQQLERQHYKMQKQMRDEHDNLLASRKKKYYEVCAVAYFNSGDFNIHDLGKDETQVYGGRGNWDIIYSALGDLGSDGWELVNVSEGGLDSKPVAWFKRRAGA